MANRASGIAHRCATALSAIVCRRVLDPAGIWFCGCEGGALWSGARLQTVHVVKYGPLAALRTLCERAECAEQLIRGGTEPTQRRSVVPGALRIWRTFMCTVETARHSSHLSLPFRATTSTHGCQRNIPSPPDAFRGDSRFRRRARHSSGCFRGGRHSRHDHLIHGTL